ncbi:MAG: LamG domain-containing protein, partial [Bacteroidetes bacterium]|nr:LamG domain-containing protein [Bacteroidota bacterium]
MRNLLRIFLIAGMQILTTNGQAQNPQVHWNFNEFSNGSIVELVSQIADTLEGNFHEAGGVIGNGIRLDGFTSCLKTQGNNRLIKGDEITIEAWVSLGNYPWNWCPVLSTVSNENQGYRLQVGPLGQASLEVAVGEQWLTCSSGNEALPLRTWMHVVGVYTAEKNLKLYINGRLVATTEIHGSIRFPNKGYQIGMITNPSKPSDIHRTWGTIEQYFGLDGILDEIKVYDTALSSDQVKTKFSSVSPGQADIAPRKLPTIENHPRRFGAFYTKLKYYPGWDDLWPVD